MCGAATTRWNRRARCSASPSARRRSPSIEVRRPLSARAIEDARGGAHNRYSMMRLTPFLVFLLAACGTTSYSDTDDAKETCRALGLEGAAYERCVERRAREAECRK